VASAHGFRINIDVLYLKNVYTVGANLAVGCFNFLEHSRVADTYLFFRTASIACSLRLPLGEDKYELINTRRYPRRYPRDKISIFVKY